jgi:hypothetical protein
MLLHKNGFLFLKKISFFSEFKMIVFLHELLFQHDPFIFLYFHNILYQWNMIKYKRDWYKKIDHFSSYKKYDYTLEKKVEFFRKKKLSFLEEKKSWVF